MITLSTVAALLVSGFMVGFLNTLAAGASVISMTLFLAMGLPIVEAIATNRLTILLQNLVSTLIFKKQRLINIRQSLKYAIPVSIGSVIGAQASIWMPEQLIHNLYVAALFAILLLVLLKQEVWLRGRPDGEQPLRAKQWALLFVAGLYGGSVYIGLGYFMLSILVMALGLDLIRANATKGLLALITTPFSLLIFIYHGQVHYAYGFVHALGNILGAYIAAQYATQIGAKKIRYILMALITLSILFAIKIVEAKDLLPF